MNTILLALNLSLTACTAFLIRNDIYLHLKTEKAIRGQNIEIAKLKEDVTYKSLEIEKAIRGEAEVIQDQVQDLKECLDNTKDKLVKEVKADLETINWNLVCTNKLMDRTPIVTVVKKD